MELSSPLLHIRLVASPIKPELAVPFQASHHSPHELADSLASGSRTIFLPILHLDRDLLLLQLLAGDQLKGGHLLITGGRDFLQERLLH